MKAKKALTVLAAFSAAALLVGATPDATPALDIAKEGASLGKWTQDYDAALKLAKEKNVPVLINFTGSDWCPWCKLMVRQVFAEKEWQDYASNRLALAWIDFPNDKSLVPEKYQKRNSDLNDKYGVEGFPTFLVLAPDGKKVLGQLGASRDASPAGFIKDLSRLTDAEKKLAALSPEKKAAYDKALADKAAAEKALEDWTATNPPANAENQKKYQDFVKRITAAQSAVDKALQ